MSRFYKLIKDGVVLTIGKDELTGETITESEYNSIKDVIDSKPEDTETEVYILDAEKMEYKAVKKVSN